MTDERLRQRNIIHIYKLYVYITRVYTCIHTITWHYMTLHCITMHYTTYHIIYIYTYSIIFTSLSIQFCLWGWARGLQASRSICYHISIYFQKLAIAAIASIWLNRHNGQISRPFVAVSQPWSPLGAIEDCPTCNLHSCLFLRHVFTCSGFWIVSCLFSGSCRKTSWRWSTRARLTKWSRVTCIVSRWQSSRRGFEIILGLV